MRVGAGVADVQNRVAGLFRTVGQSVRGVLSESSLRTLLAPLSRLVMGVRPYSASRVAGTEAWSYSVLDTLRSATHGETTKAGTRIP